MTGNGKPKVGFYWCGTCGGCEEAVVDLAEAILDVVAAVDIVFWPVALDFKIEDVEAMDDGSIAVSFINGAIRNSEDEHVSKLLRQKSGLIVAFGSCSHMGGIPGLMNFTNGNDEVMEQVYINAPSIDNPEGIIPSPVFTDEQGIELELPVLYDAVKRLDDIIPVDYYLPGCAPTPPIIANAVNAILTGNLPPSGTVLSTNRNMCEECVLEQVDTKIKIKEFKRVHEIIPEPGRCLLEQGVICMGPVTRGGCGGLCMKANMPCRGCFGPTDPITEQHGDMGTAFIASLGALIDTIDEDEIDKIMKSIKSYNHVAYMFSLPSSIMRRKTQEVVR